MPARSSQTEQKPTFIFNGTIKKLKRARMDDVPVNDRTAVVTVDKILEAPPALTDYAGHDITVQIGGRAKLKVGDKMTFYTTSWMYGDSIAVRSLKQEPLKCESTATRGATADPSERNAQRKTREHYNKATLVISGKVISVSTPDELAQESAAPSEKAPGGPVSEHDPEWREAVVEVSDVHKGSKKKRVVVRFAASTDVTRDGAPKSHPGHQGDFMPPKAKGQA